MAMKPNYFQQRADRNRAKEAKKLEKQQKRDEETARRKAEREAGRESDGSGGEVARVTLT